MNLDPSRELTPDEPIAELRRALQSLRTLFHLTTLCGIIISATIFVLLLKQLTLVRRQNQELTTYINDYNKNFVPQVENIRTNLTEFARAHPSLNPIVQKYFSTNASAVAPRPTP